MFQISTDILYVFSYSRKTLIPISSFDVSPTVAKIEKKKNKKQKEVSPILQTVVHHLSNNRFG